MSICLGWRGLLKPTFIHSSDLPSASAGLQAQGLSPVWGSFWGGPKIWLARYCHRIYGVYIQKNSPAIDLPSKSPVHTLLGSVRKTKPIWQPSLSILTVSALFSRCYDDISVFYSAMISLNHQWSWSSLVAIQCPTGNTRNFLRMDDGLSV